jgi:hypothetical protein
VHRRKQRAALLDEVSSSSCMPSTAAADFATAATLALTSSTAALPADVTSSSFSTVTSGAAIAAAAATASTALLSLPGIASAPVEPSPAAAVAAPTPPSSSSPAAVAGGESAPDLETLLYSGCTTLKNVLSLAHQIILNNIVALFNGHYDTLLQGDLIVTYSGKWSAAPVAPSLLQWLEENDEALYLEYVNKVVPALSTNKEMGLARAYFDEEAKRWTPVFIWGDEGELQQAHADSKINNLLISLIALQRNIMTKMLTKGQRPGQYAPDFQHSKSPPFTAEELVTDETGRVVNQAVRQEMMRLHAALLTTGLSSVDYEPLMTTINKGEGCAIGNDGKTYALAGSSVMMTSTLAHAGDKLERGAGGKSWYLSILSPSGGLSPDTQLFKLYLNELLFGVHSVEAVAVYKRWKDDCSHDDWRVAARSREIDLDAHLEEKEQRVYSRLAKKKKKSTSIVTG